MIKNSVSINKQKSVEELNQIIAKLTKELAQLKLFIQGLGHAVPKGLDVVVSISFPCAPHPLPHSFDHI
jgi:hypothetical protein